MARIIGKRQNARSGGDELALGIGNAMGAIAGDEEVLGVAHLAHLADLLARLVVNPDLAPDIAWMIPIEHGQRPAIGQECLDLLSAKISLIIERHNQGARVDRIDEPGEGVGDFDLGVIRAFALSAVDALACDAIDLGVVPPDECLPDVVVAQV